MTFAGKVLMLLLLAGWSVAGDPAGAAAPPRNAYTYDATVPATWFHEIYERVKAENLSPPVAARVYGAAAVALYEGAAGGMRRHRTLVGQLNGLDSVPTADRNVRYHWPTAANRALSRVLARLFAERPASLEAFDRVREAFDREFESSVRPFVYRRSVKHGNQVGHAVARWIAGDGAATLQGCAFTPPVGPGLWEPTPPAFTPSPLEACWGRIRPFVLTSGRECAPPPPPPFSTDERSTFFGDALEVRATGDDLTSEEETIARYWSDGAGTTGTPPGHWIDIARQLSLDLPLSLGDSAEAFARVGIAVADAFIGCWDAKYTHNLLRPVTYIQRHIDPTWVPLLPTPPFPEYSSGHSTQSAAAATVLGDLFGESFTFTDRTRTDHAVLPPLADRSFESFQEAAEEAAVSRLFGGIHYRFGNENGLAQGRCIGATILERVRFRER